MGPDTAHEEFYEWIPLQGCPQAYRDATAERPVWRVGLPPVGGSDGGVGLVGGGDYVSRHQNIVAQYIATRSNMDLCLAAKWRPGPRVATRWWDQEGLDLVGMQTAAREAEQTDGEEEMDRTGTETEH